MPRECEKWYNQRNILTSPCTLTTSPCCLSLLFCQHLKEKSLLPLISKQQEPWFHSKFYYFHQFIVKNYKCLDLSFCYIIKENFHSALRKLNKQPAIHVDASYQVSVHLARQFQRRNVFRYRPIRNKNCLWWPCLLTDRDEMSNLHRGHSIQMLPAMFRLIWPSGFRGGDFF